jgi:CRP-like cAMP-binding protein
MKKALYILADMDDRDILWISQAGRLREMAPGEVLIRAGEAVGELYFVTEGSLEVTAGGHHVARLTTGDVIGEMSFVEKRPPSATVSALENAHVLAIPRDAIIAAFEADQGFAARFYRALAVFLSDRLRTATSGGEDDGELDEGLLDSLSQAGDRFMRLIGLMEGRIR